MVPLFSGFFRDTRFIINMDQTPIFLECQKQKHSKKKGLHTINALTCKGASKRVTVAVTVTAAGTFLPPMIVYKGKANGRIKRELRDYPDSAVYSVQNNAWMDHDIMVEWIEKVLSPYIHTCPTGIRPVLLLDGYRVHVMNAVVALIQGKGVHVEHIPPGCTGVCQPVDVGINKPFKTRVKQHFCNYIMAHAPSTTTFCAPLHPVLAL